MHAPDPLTDETLLSDASASTDLQCETFPFRQLLETSADIPFALDAKGTLIYIGPQVERYGANAADLTGRSFKALLHGDDHQAGRERFERLRLNQTGAPLELRLQFKPGCYILLEENSRAHFDEARQFAGIFGHFRDVEQRRQLQESRLHAERLQAVNYLAGGVAHQFNNIHAGLLGYVDLLINQNDLSDRTHVLTKKIQRATQRAVQITRDLSEYAGLNDNPQGHCLPRHVVQSILKVTREEMEAEGIRITTDLSETPPVAMNARHLGQILMNLVINARHSLLDQKQRHIHITISHPRSQQVAIAVQDSGCGMSESDRQRVFLPFFSTKGEHAPSRSSQAQIRGIGLGLSVSAQVLKQHGGRIEADQNAERGMTFTIVLPTSASPASHSHAGSSSYSTDRARMKGARILIVDDEPAVRQAYEGILSAHGCEVKAVANGRTAIRALMRTQYNLILLDLKMPLMTGNEFLETIAHLPEPQQPRVLIITGLPEQDFPDLSPYPIAGPIQKKPMPMDILVEQVNQALSRQSSDQ